MEDLSMPYKDDLGRWHCKYCDDDFPNELGAQGCENNHEIIYIPFYKEDLQRLLQFMFTKDDNLLTERLVKLLQHYTTHMKGSQE